MTNTFVGEVSFFSKIASDAVEQGQTIKPIISDSIGDIAFSGLASPVTDYFPTYYHILYRTTVLIFTRLDIVRRLLKNMHNS